MVDVEDETNTAIWRLICRIEDAIGEDEDAKVAAVAAGALAKFYGAYAERALGKAWKYTQKTMENEYFNALLESQEILGRTG